MVCVLALSIIALGWGIYGIRGPLPLPFLYPMRHTTALCVGMLAISIIGILRSKPKTRLVFRADSRHRSRLLALAAQIYRWNSVNVSAKDPAPFIVSFIHTAFPNALCFLICGFAMMLLSGHVRACIGPYSQP